MPKPNSNLVSKPQYNIHVCKLYALIYVHLLSWELLSRAVHAWNECEKVVSKLNITHASLVIKHWRIDKGPLFVFIFIRSIMHYLGHRKPRIQKHMFPTLSCLSIALAPGYPRRRGAATKSLCHHFIILAIIRFHHSFLQIPGSFVKCFYCTFSASIIVIKRNFKIECPISDICAVNFF